MLRYLEPETAHEPQIIDLEPHPFHVSGRAILALMFGGLMVWWALGVSAFIQNLLIVPMLVALFVRGRIRVPRTFVWWLLFVLWVAVSASQVDTTPRWASYLLRTGLYVAGTILFLFIYNSPRKVLPSRYIVHVLAMFWAVTTLGGIGGMVAPNFDFTTPFEAILPQSALQERFVRDLVHASNASPQAFLGTSIRRPRAPHWGTNHWGAFFAMTLPFAVAALFTMRSRLWRGALALLIAGSIFPLVFSFNRGAWMGAAGGMILALSRLAAGNRRTARFARMLIIIGIVSGAAFLMTPLVDLVLYRALGSGFVDTRQTYIIGALSAARLSPILGFGTTIDAAEIGLQARRVALGSNGQFWTVLVSQGYPGLLFYVAFFVALIAKSWRMVPASGGRDPISRFWAHIAIVAGVLQMPLYEMIPWGTVLLMVAGAIALREARPAYALVRGPSTEEPVTAPPGRSRPAPPPRRWVAPAATPFGRPPRPA